MSGQLTQPYPSATIYSSPSMPLHALMKIIKASSIRILLLFLFTQVFFLKNADGQSLVLSSAGTTGEYSSNQSITLAPGFSSSGPFRAFITSGLTIPLASAPSQDQNYVRSRIYKVPSLAELSTPFVSQVSESIQYVDGLGRPLQNIQTKASPNGYDIVQPFAYDALGRETVKYLPYTEQSGGGSLRKSALSTQASFYSTAGWDAAVAKTSAPYSVMVMENSSLGKVLEQGAPGTPWQPASARSSSTGRTLVTDYGVNNSSVNYTTDGFAARLWISSPVASNDFQRVLSTTGFYAAGMLSVKIIKDENWTAGKAGTSEEYMDKEGHIVLKRVFNIKDGAMQTLSTYYVYDDMGNLTFVLPPGTNPDAGSVATAALNQYGYQYYYDGRQRVIEKKIPGKGWDKIVYNKLNQPVLSQDSVQRVNGQWLFTKYDGLGRVIMNGLYNDAASRTALEINITAQGTLWETRQSGDVGYTSLAFPQSFNLYHEILYYDDYAFTGASSYIYAGSSKTRGLLTGKRTTVLGTGDMLLSVNYYDEDGRVAKVFKQHYKSSAVTNGNYDEVTNSYNFESKLTASTRIHHNGTANTVISSRWDYDHVGRKLKSYAQIGTGAEVILSSNQYNEIGQLTSKAISNGGSTINYRYNERGWLKSLNSPQFSEYLNYEDGSLPQWNGNISNQSWGAGSSLGNKFSYTYDAINRLTAASSTGILMSESLSYDVMGNIAALTRDGQSGTYNYDGNRLTGISGTLATGGYSYDGNGNASTDGRVGVNISYNYLNLPKTVSKAGLSLSYTYDATGSKLKKVNGTNITHYIDGIQYANDAIDFIQTEEGIARNNNGSYSFEYNIADHLGNVRASIYRNPSSGNIETIQQDNYYAFGLRKLAQAGTNKYLYNGKELQDELGQYDYGARFYDPVVGRWNVIDNKSESYESISPYVYAVNDPINAIDPDGNLIIFINGFVPQHFLRKDNTRFFGSGVQNSNYRPYPGSRGFSSGTPTYLGESFDYWRKIDDAFMQGYKDNHAIYLNGSSSNESQAEDRFSEGETSGNNLVAQLDAGKISLANGETIKIVGHSQGGAFAAGIASVLSKNERYKSILEQVVYLEPHQPQYFKNPNNVSGLQISSQEDLIASKNFGFIFKGGKTNYSRIKGISKFIENKTHDGDKLRGHSIDTNLDEIANYFREKGVNVTVH